MLKFPCVITDGICPWYAGISYRTPFLCPLSPLLPRIPLYHFTPNSLHAFLYAPLSAPIRYFIWSAGIPLHTTFYLSESPYISPEPGIGSCEKKEKKTPYPPSCKQTKRLGELTKKQTAKRKAIHKEAQEQSATRQTFRPFPASERDKRIRESCGKERTKKEKENKTQRVENGMIPRKKQIKKERKIKWTEWADSETSCREKKRKAGTVPPYSYVAGDTAWISRKINGGRSQRQKPPFNIRTVSTSQPKIWVQRASRWYHRKNSRKNISEITPQKNAAQSQQLVDFTPLRANRAIFPHRNVSSFKDKDIAGRMPSAGIICRNFSSYQKNRVPGMRPTCRVRVSYIF